MANLQPARTTHLPSKNPMPINRIDLSQVSLSQLLGRDYLFIDFTDQASPQDDHLFNEAIESLFGDLGLNHNETLVVSVIQTLDGNQFSRHELTWLGNKIRRRDIVEITTPEQTAFMQMIWQCTSPIQEF